MENGQTKVFEPRLVQDGTDRYQLIRPLGEGGMAKVYLAHDTKTDEMVAIKILQDLMRTEDGYARFLREMRFMQKFAEHPNIVTWYSTGTETIGDVVYIFMAMEYFEGQDLTVMIDDLYAAQGGRTIEGSLVPTKDLYPIMEQLLLALVAIHDAKIVHRDLKPHNILWRREEDGELLVKLTDFGIGKQLEDATQLIGDVAKPKVNTMIGTPLYFSPEQAFAEDIDARADLYAVGAILYELVTGRTTIDFKAFGQLCYDLRNPFDPERYPSRIVAGMNPELERLILDLIERDPDKRIPSAREALKRLRRVRASERRAEAAAGSWWTKAAVAVRSHVETLQTLFKERSAAKTVAIGAIAAGIVIGLVISQTGGGADVPEVVHTASASERSSPSPAPGVEAPSPSTSRPPLRVADIPAKDRRNFEKAVRTVKRLRVSSRCSSFEKATFLDLTIKHPDFPDPLYWAAECMGRDGNRTREQDYRDRYAEKSGGLTRPLLFRTP